MECLAGSKMTHSPCVCSTHQNVVLLVDAIDWDVAYKELKKKIIYNPQSNKCIMHWCEFCPGTVTLKEFLDQELNEHEDDEKFNYCQWDTTDRAILITFTTTYEEHKETWIDPIDDLTSYCKLYSLQEYIPCKNTESYIPWLYTTWDQMVASNMIHCVLVLMTTTITQAFCIKFKQCLFIILKLITHI